MNWKAVEDTSFQQWASNRYKELEDDFIENTLLNGDDIHDRVIRRGLQTFKKTDKYKNALTEYMRVEYDDWYSAMMDDMHEERCDEQLWTSGSF